jgi:hypothetical protein
MVHPIALDGPVRERSGGAMAIPSNSAKRLRRTTLLRIGWIGRGRDTAYAVPPAQIRTGGFPAYGSCLR